MSDLLEDGLLSQTELEEIWEGLPKAGDGALIGLAGFVVFAQKVTN